MGRSSRAKCMSMYRLVLKRMLFRRRAGLFFNIIPNMAVKIARDMKGIKSSFPASV